MYILARLFIACALLLAILFGCKTAPRYQKGGTGEQSFHASPAWTGVTPAVPPSGSPAPGGQSQSFTQPENAQGQSNQAMTEDRTTIHPDGTIERVKRSAATVVGGSQGLAGILKDYYGQAQTKALVLALLMGGAAWYLRGDWPVVSIMLASGACVTAFWGLWAAAITAAVCGGIFLAYHVLKARFPVPLP